MTQNARYYQPARVSEVYPEKYKDAPHHPIQCSLIVTYENSPDAKDVFSAGYGSKYCYVAFTDSAEVFNVKYTFYYKPFMRNVVVRAHKFRESILNSISEKNFGRAS